MSFTTPSAEELEELILACRYGDEEDLVYVKDFIEKFGGAGLILASDDRGNTALHMAGGNGHLEIARLLLGALPSTALIKSNNSLSTPLHWISLNYHLAILEILCPLLSPSAYLLLNGHNKTAVQEAEEGCEAYLVKDGEGNETTPRGVERIRREAVIGFILTQMGLATDAEIAKDTEKRNGQTELTNLEKSVDGIKLEGGEKSS